MHKPWRTSLLRLFSVGTRLGVIGTASWVVSTSRRRRSFCAASVPVLAPKYPHILHADVLHTPVSTIEWIKTSLLEAIHQINRVGYSLWRLFYICLHLTPPLLLAPLLLFNNHDIALTWSRILKTCIENCGPCCIKFAQWIATRPDLFPLYVCETLEGLQAESRTQSAQQIIRSLRLAFGDSYSDSISLDEAHMRVLGSGCVAEVVLASYRGKPVAVKVLHPGVRRDILVDLDLLRLCANLIEVIPGMENLSLVEMTEEFSELMLRQLDMRVEAAALDRFRNNFADKRWRRISFPKVLFSSEMVLVESFEEGDLLSKALRTNLTPVACKDIAGAGVDAFLKMVFVDNFVHGDLHPGNIILRRHGRNFELVFIDAGLTVGLQPTDRRNFIDLFTAIVKRDANAVGRLMVERSRGKRCANPAAFERDLAEIVNDVHSHGLSLGRIKVGDLLQRVLVLCYMHGVKLESRFANLILAIGVIEGLGRRLDPDLDLISKAAPFILKSSIV